MFCLSAGGKKEWETKAPDQLTCDQALIFFFHFSGGEEEGLIAGYVANLQLNLCYKPFFKY